ncbi:hypothetical protein [Catenulispora rubra]|uniref:hypothetical protein n=1 Tax=Catenulispora rubra TaxID=280293 RepID=UPI0018921B06|nr:hypothetical protein [Catenulispora rubra]
MPSARRRSRKLIGAVAAFAVAVLATACGNGNSPSPVSTPTDATTAQEPSASPSSPDTAAIGAPQATFYNLLDACSGKAVPGAAAYTGSGPHPVAFYDLPIRSDQPQDGTILGEPDTWSGGQPYDVQLVACVAAASGPVAKTCDYGSVVPEAMTMHWGEYTITLYRATTAAKVAVVKIQGADDSCPASITAPTGDNGPAPETSTVTADQLTKALGGYIN